MTNNDTIYMGGGIRRNPNRIIGLDLLRISLALQIFMFHSWMHFGCSYSYLNDFVSMGAIAMTGFFLLSGYSLYQVYGEQDIMDKHNIGRFYIKRTISIVPLYYILSILYICLKSKESLLDNVLLFPIEALGLQTTLTSLFKVTHNGGTWFISCIILAYLIYPFLQTICNFLSAKHKVIMLIILVCLDVWGAIISCRFDTAWTYDNPFYRILEFACGMLIADINIKYDNKLLQLMRSRGMLICSVIILIIGVSLMRHYLHLENYMLYNVIVIPCFILIIVSLGKRSLPMLEKLIPISYLGKISYAFYLTQFFVWDICRRGIEYIGFNHNWFRILISISFCMIISILAYELIQKPISKYLNYKIVKYHQCNH